MEKNNTINNLKEVLESSTMTTYLNSVSSERQKLIWLQKALYFMISTGNYEDVYIHLLKSNDFTFPTEYLAQKSKNNKEIQAILKHNYLENGFWYHGTSKYVSEDILEKGLCGLEQRYGKDFINDLVNINDLCKDIAISTEKYSLGKIKLSEELPLDFLKGKLNKVYMTAELSQAFNYADNSNAWIKTFIINLLNYFDIKLGYLDLNNKNILLEQLAKGLEESKGILSKIEIVEIMNFLNKYFNELEVSNKLKDKAIVFINHNVILNKLITYHDDKNRGIAYLLGQINAQELASSHINPNDLAVLSFNDNGSLSLKLGKKEK